MMYERGSNVRCVCVSEEKVRKKMKERSCVGRVVVIIKEKVMQAFTDIDNWMSRYQIII